MVLYVLWQVDRLQDKVIRSEFQSQGDLYQEGVVGEELVHRKASKWGKVIDKASLIALVCRLIIFYCRLVSGKMKSFIYL